LARAILAVSKAPAWLVYLATDTVLQSAINKCAHPCVCVCV